MSIERQREREVARHLARALGVPFVDLDEYSISPGILSKLPLDTMVENRCLPMIFNSRRVVLLVDDASRMARLSSGDRIVGAPVGRRFEFAITTRSGVDAGIERRRALRR